MTHVKGKLFEALDAVVGKTLDELPLAPHDVRKIDADVARVDAEFRSFAHIVNRVARCNQRFTGHAAAQNAESAERSVVDEGYVGA